MMIKIQSAEPGYLPELYIEEKEVQDIKDLIAWEYRVTPEEVEIKTMLAVDYSYEYTNSHHYVKVVTNLGVIMAHCADTLNGIDWSILRYFNTSE